MTEIVQRLLPPGLAAAFFLAADWNLIPGAHGNGQHHFFQLLTCGFHASFASFGVFVLLAITPETRLILSSADVFRPNLSLLSFP